MSRIEPTQDNQKLMRVNVPALPVEPACQAKAFHVSEGSVVRRRPIHARDYC